MLPTQEVFGPSIPDPEYETQYVTCEYELGGRSATETFFEGDPFPTEVITRNDDGTVTTSFSLSSPDFSMTWGFKICCATSATVLNNASGSGSLYVNVYSDGNVSGDEYNISSGVTEVIDLSELQGACGAVYFVFASQGFPVPDIDFDLTI